MKVTVENSKVGVATLAKEQPTGPLAYIIWHVARKDLLTGRVAEVQDYA